MSREEHLSIAQAAECLGVSTKTVRRWIKAGKLPAELIPGLYGPEYRIPASAVPEEAPPPARKLPRPVRVQLERGVPLYDGLLIGWRLEGRRAVALVALPGRQEPVAVDPMRLY